MTRRRRPSPRGPDYRVRGEQNGRHKLTEAEVAEIRTLWEQGMSSRKIGRLFRIHSTTAWAVATKRTWKETDAHS